MKKCTNCKQIKALSEFYNATSFKDGKTYQCKTCMSNYRKSKKEENRKYAELNRLNNTEKVKEQKRNSWRNLDPRKKLLQQCKNRSKKRNIEFNLQLEDIIIPELCPYLLVPFIVGTKGNYEYTHSIDRIDNSKGYVKGNIEVVTKKANSMKNSASKEELLNFANSIISRFS
jgi:hypothetical protein